MNSANSLFALLLRHTFFGNKTPPPIQSQTQSKRKHFCSWKSLAKKVSLSLEHVHLSDCFCPRFSQRICCSNESIPCFKKFKITTLFYFSESQKPWTEKFIPHWRCRQQLESLFSSRFSEPSKTWPNVDTSIHTSIFTYFQTTDTGIEMSWNKNYIKINTKGTPNTMILISPAKFKSEQYKTLQFYCVSHQNDEAQQQ